MSGAVLHLSTLKPAMHRGFESCASVGAMQLAAQQLPVAVPNASCKYVDVPAWQSCADARVGRCNPLILLCQVPWPRLIEPFKTVLLHILTVQ